ncbi:uncharacterized protein [Pseudorasbora parva]|uniref:uncharacterized protein isoform X2 n=1 Tax=Pseudorasbora parva TaxID=51549 RepID=UPI00351E7D5E
MEFIKEENTDMKNSEACRVKDEGTEEQKGHHMASTKSHKGMSDADWVARLESFARTGVWPSREGNRPSPRQKRWHELHQKIEMCPLQMRGQNTLLKEAQKCICGFHKVHSPVTENASQSTPAQSTPSIRDLSHPAKMAKLNLTMAPPVPGVQSPSAAPLPSAMAVEEHCIPGKDWVDELAECLVELRIETSLTLTNQQAATIVGLWQHLDQFDKDRVMYAARHQDRLLTGRFRSPKKKAVLTPGVDSTKRCVLGSSSSPAQWPNCCRLVEMIFIKLCNIHQTPQKQQTESLSRWDLILLDYRKIQQLILSNGTVMSKTALQLVEVDQKNLTTWHNECLQGQEVSGLLRGLKPPEACPVSLDALHLARVQPVVSPQYSHQLHNYQMPPDTAGQANTKFRKIQPSAACTSATATSFEPSALHPQRSATFHQLRKIYPRPTAPHPLVPDTPIAPVVSQMLLLPCPAPFSTFNPGAISSVPPPTKRLYKRSVKANTCRKCGQFRTQETGHSQFRGKIFCPNKETITKEQWLQIMRK